MVYRKNSTERASKTSEQQSELDSELLELLNSVEVSEPAEPASDSNELDSDILELLKSIDIKASVKRNSYGRHYNSTVKSYKATSEACEPAKPYVKTSFTSERPVYRRSYTTVRAMEVMDAARYYSDNASKFMSWLNERVKRVNVTMNERGAVKLVKRAMHDKDTEILEY